MILARFIAWGFVLVGLLIVGYNGYKWWGEINIVVQDPQLAMSIAEDWNDTTTQKALTKVETEPNAKPTKLETGEKIGELIIPRIGGILPIVEGTDPNSLEKGVGKYKGYGTVAPDQTGHVVLSGHRDTVFRKIGKLQDGDRLYIRFKGKIYTYQIRKRWVTHADDRTVIVPINRPVLTLTTCYPFDYIGDAPDRYIIRADLIEVKDDQTQSI